MVPAVGSSGRATLMPVGSIFSGEPLPVAPRETNPERSSFDRKLLDYLRRLTGRLEGLQVPEPTPPTPGGETLVETFAAVKEKNIPQTLDAYVFTPVEWPVVLWKDSVYAHDVDNSATIQVLEDGLYFVVAEVSFDTVYGYNFGDLMFVVVDGNGSALWRPYFGSTQFDYGTTGTLAVAVPLIAGIRFQIWCRPNYTNTAAIETSTRITIMRIRTDAEGGNNPNGPGIGWNPDPNNPERPTWAIAQLLTDLTALDGLTDTIEFYSSATSGGAVDVLNTVEIVAGRVMSWTQTAPLGTPAGWQFNAAANSGHALLATWD